MSSGRSISRSIRTQASSSSGVTVATEKPCPVVPPRIETGRRLRTQAIDEPDPASG
jgi:hypothetical protein